MNQQAATATRRDKLTSGQRQRPIEWRRGSRSGTILKGGTLEVASGGSTGSGAVTFSGGGTLMLDDSLQFGGLVAGFGVPDRIGLADFPFLAGTLYRRVNADVRQRFPLLKVLRTLHRRWLDSRPWTRCGQKAGSKSRIADDQTTRSGEATKFNGSLPRGRLRAQCSSAPVAL